MICRIFIQSASSAAFTCMPALLRAWVSVPLPTRFIIVDPRSVSEAGDSGYTFKPTEMDWVLLCSLCSSFRCSALQFLAGSDSNPEARLLLATRITWLSRHFEVKQLAQLKLSEEWNWVLKSKHICHCVLQQRATFSRFEAVQPRLIAFLAEQQAQTDHFQPIAIALIRGPACLHPPPSPNQV